MSEERNLVCCKCNVNLVRQKTVFNYMGFTFNEVMPRCPVCGLVYISEEIVAGRMADVEMQLEEK